MGNSRGGLRLVTRVMRGLQHASTHLMTQLTIVLGYENFCAAKAALAATFHVGQER
jgi:hypothetical protein